MKHEIKMVKENYNKDAVSEWERLFRHPVEYAITLKYTDGII